ncbi:hypothetical protein [Armatimonas rosea]|uniref:Uncharacterized protein n=1 Tax=Armatimonas rosea TaxID=685828 RepID=A0A7W9W7P8_ARMRO|nr:hypothetical protein [Armatimonas rosea]MBB6050837.1 hypothetical protein [Armatimonas rosea]
MKKNPLSLLCLTLSVAILLTLSLHPKTGWLVRQQAQAAFGGKGPALVKALDGPAVPPKLSPAGELARTLRELCREKLTLERKAEEVFYQGHSEAGFPKTYPKDLSLYDILALTEAGEQCDPGNAFFPTLRAVALLAFHSDSQALAALHQAAQCPRWDDYTNEEVLARLAQLDHVQGRHSALAEMQVEQSLIAPHFGRLRALARVVTVLAAKREQAGALTEGLALRHDLRALGVLLREQPGLPLTAHTGITLTAIATARPGGELPRKYTGSSEETKQARRRDTLAAHTKYWGAAEASAVAQLWKRNEEAKALHGTFTLASDSFYGLAAEWQVGLRGLATLLATLLIGAFCALVARLHRQRAACLGIRLGLWLMLGIVPLAVWRSGLSESEVWLSLGLLLAQGGIGLFTLWQAWRTMERGRYLLEVVVMAATVLALGQLVLLASVAMWGAEDTINTFYDTYLRCFSASAADPQPWWQALGDEACSRAFFAFPALYPLLCLVPVLAIVSRVKRVPVVFGVLRGLGRCTLPLVLALTLAYAWQVERTAHREARLTAELRAFYTRP